MPGFLDERHDYAADIAQEHRHFISLSTRPPLAALSYRDYNISRVCVKMPAHAKKRQDWARRSIEAAIISPHIRRPLTYFEYIQSSHVRPVIGSRRRRQNAIPPASRSHHHLLIRIIRQPYVTCSYGFDAATFQLHFGRRALRAPDTCRSIFAYMQKSADGP